MFYLKYDFTRIRFVFLPWTVHIDVKLIFPAPLYHSGLIYLLTQSDFAKCHTSSVMLYRRDANNLSEPNKQPFAAVCNRYLLIQYDV